MRHQMNRIFDSFNRSIGLGRAFRETSGPFLPRLDVTEDAKAFMSTWPRRSAFPPLREEQMRRTENLSAAAVRLESFRVPPDMMGAA
jgi:hypothetical protein